MKKITCLAFAALLSATALQAQRRKGTMPIIPGHIESFYDQGRYKEAAAVADEHRAQKVATTASEMFTYARVYARTGQKAKAIASLNEAIDKGFLNINDIKNDEALKSALSGAPLDSAVSKVRNTARPYLNGSAKLSQAEKEEVIALVRKGLRNTYFDTTLGKSMSLDLKRMLDGGFYSQIDSSGAFLREVVNFLRAKTNDKHFWVGPNYGALSERVPNVSATTPSERNFGYKEIAIRPGNIGYLRWDECIAGEEAYKTAQNALGFLRNTRAIIIDISHNGGGNGNASTFLYHYLFPPQDKRFETLLIKKCRGEADWHRSEPTVTPLPGGPFLGDKPVYILTSGNTFSAAEYFAFVMKELKRATIIGENTGGGGNPVNMLAEKNFSMYIPVCQITTTEGKSLEGKGVAPDIVFKTKDWQKEMLDVVTADLRSKGK